MCGISGVFSQKVNGKQIQLLEAIIHSQINRGPDYQSSTKITGKRSEILLGHNRLSIIDLSNQANQPMWDSSGRYCIVFNGEIYNYLEIRQELITNGLIFQTQGDTEVILNAFSYWGIDALQHFKGPFAFAIFDNISEKLWLFRDRFGVRPLYYIQQGNHLYFASSTPVLAKYLNLQPNLNYVANGLNYLIYEDGSDISPYEGLKNLKAGSYLEAEFDNAGQLHLENKTYYHLETVVQQHIETISMRNTDYLVALINDCFAKSVEIRLRSDVPLAISISGGLDSSSVASYVHKLNSNTVGFSYGHPQNKQSEGPVVAKCAKYLGMHIEYISPSLNEMIDALENTIQLQDAPFSSLSIVAQNLLYQKVKAQGFKVLLGGQGGDEVFMGYKKYLFFWVKNILKNKSKLKNPKNLIDILTIVASEMTSLKSYWRHSHRYFSKKAVAPSALILPLSPKLDLSRDQDIMWRRQSHDINYFSLPTLLRYEDRNAMGNSVESRLPYMDHQLVELGLALPEALKIRSGYGKWIMRQILKDKIPNEIRLARFKRGFDIPLKALLSAGLGTAIRHSLQSNPQINKEFLKDPETISHTFSDINLLNRPKAMTEAISLLWLNKVYT